MTFSRLVYSILWRNLHKTWLVNSDKIITCSHNFLVYYAREINLTEIVKETFKNAFSLILVLLLVHWMNSHKNVYIKLLGVLS